MSGAFAAQGTGRGDGLLQCDRYAAGRRPYDDLLVARGQACGYADVELIDTHEEVAQAGEIDRRSRAADGDLGLGALG